MWSQHGFWNNLEPISGPGGGGGYQHPGGYPGYQDQELSSFYKQHYGYDPAAVFGQKQDSDSPSRGKILRYFSVLHRNFQDSGSGSSKPGTGGVATQKPERLERRGHGEREPRQVVLTSY